MAITHPYEVKADQLLFITVQSFSLTHRLKTDHSVFYEPDWPLFIITYKDNQDDLQMRANQLNFHVKLSVDGTRRVTI